MLSVSWRWVYFTSIGLRFLLALSDSYIHPDEHFQSLEVLGKFVLGYNVVIPWEFTSDQPARSYASLLPYYPVFVCGSKLGLLPLQIWYCCRLVLMILSWMVTDFCIFRMLPNKQERIKAIFFTLTSFITLVYQSHTFSNSLETVLVICAIYSINEARFLLEDPTSQQSKTESLRLGVQLGALVAIGTFNRATFPAFLILPCCFIAPSIWRKPSFASSALLTFILSSLISVVTDTFIYTGKTPTEQIHNWNTWSQYVVAPLNSLLYNTKQSNLALHGLHPYYTHLLVNLPQMFGPGILYLLPGFRNQYWRTTPFLAALSGLVFLSVVPHQELRFLMPLVPLLCCCIDVSGLDRITRDRKWVQQLLMNLWLVFNGLMLVLTGLYHQGGVVPAVDYLRQAKLTTNTTLVWWRTYSPPSWMLADTSQDAVLTTNAELCPKAGMCVVDAMSMDPEKFSDLLTSFDKSRTVYVITPKASYEKHFGKGFNEVWSYNVHYDMDHLDFSDLSSLRPGLGIYELL